LPLEESGDHRGLRWVRLAGGRRVKALGLLWVRARVRVRVGVGVRVRVGVGDGVGVGVGVGVRVRVRVEADRLLLAPRLELLVARLVRVWG
jgi:hypothetical protein